MGTTQVGGFSWDLAATIDQARDRLASSAAARRWALVWTGRRFDLLRRSPWDGRDHKVLHGRLVADEHGCRLEGETAASRAPDVGFVLAGIAFAAVLLWTLFTPGPIAVVPLVALIGLIPGWLILFVHRENVEHEVAALLATDFADLRPRAVIGPYR